MNEKQMTLARDWDGRNVKGWFCSEKLNGCRAFWDGKQFWTRDGNIIKAPNYFTRNLPNVPLDGEIWAGRKGFQIASNAVRIGGRWFDDNFIEFSVFDFPSMAGTWDKRMNEASKAVKGCSCANAVKIWRIGQYSDIVQPMLKIRPIGGEGIVFRNPDVTIYEAGRTENLLRFKFIQN